jgi:CRISPR/Cas system CMR-associated protein Cmr5 small subunit
MSSLQTFEQNVAKLAWERVSAAKVSLKTDFKSYASLSDSAPGMIIAVGLAATVAFYQSKKYAHHGQLVQDWAFILGVNDKELMPYLLKDVTTYRHATDTIMRHQEWIKRFAKALKDSKEGS